MKLINGEGNKMIALTYNQLRDPEFNPVLMRLVHTKLKYKLAKKVLKLLQAVQREQKKSDVIWNELVEKYLETATNDKGEPIGLRVKESFSDEEKGRANEALEIFGNTVVELETCKMKSDELTTVDFSPADLMRIEDLIED